MKSMSTMPNSKLPRRRELNLIYFIDSSSTRSLRLPLKTAIFFLSLATMIFVWFLLSFWLLFVSWHERADLRRQASGLLSTIFDYQTRYDQVYENAYPNLSELLANREKHKNEKMVAEKSEATSKSLAAKSLQASKQSDDLAKNKGSAIDESKEKQSGIESLDIDPPKFKMNGNRLSANFAIKNQNPSSRATGYVWAVAQIRNQAGEDYFIAQPPGVEVDSVGVAHKPQVATRFSIKRFKPVVVHFDRPPRVSGKFEELRITLATEGGQKTEFKYEIDLKKIAVKSKEPTAAVPDAEDHSLEEEPPSFDHDESSAPGAAGVEPDVTTQGALNQKL